MSSESRSRDQNPNSPNFKVLSCECTEETLGNGTKFLHYDSRCKNKKHIPKGIRDKKGEAD